MRTRYVTMTVALLAVLFIGLTHNINAAGQPAFYVRTDRASYVPGDSGTLLITIRNIGDQAFTIKNLTIVFSWLAYLNDHWDGNYTKTSINQAIATGQVYNTQQGFTVPNDGRATIDSSVRVTVGTDLTGGGGPYRNSGDVSIGIAAATYEPLSFTSSILPIISIAVLAVVAVVLALMLVSIRKMAKK